MCLFFRKVESKFTINNIVVGCKCFSAPSTEFIIAMIWNTGPIEIRIILSHIYRIWSHFKKKHLTNYHKNPPFFDDEPAPFTFLLLLFVVELTRAVTLPLEFVFDIVVDLDAVWLAFGLLTTDCIFDTVWLLASALPVPFCWAFTFVGLTIALDGSSQKQFAFPLPDGIDAVIALPPDCSLPQIIDHCETADHLSSFFAFCCFCWAA